MNPQIWLALISFLFGFIAGFIVCTYHRGSE